jgi:hypothetical protein
MAHGALAGLPCLARMKGRGGGAPTYLGEEEKMRPRWWPESDGSRGGEA